MIKIRTLLLALVYCCAPAAIAAGDTQYPDVSLLLPMTGSNNSTTFTDTSISPKTITAGGNAKIITTQTDPFGGSNGVGYFDGAGDYLTTPYAAADYNWWTADYTLEAWVYVSSYTGWSYTIDLQIPTCIGNSSPSGASNYWSFGPLSDGKIAFYYYNGGSNLVQSSSTISANSWHHIAFTKTSSGITLFVGGVKQTTVAIVGTPQSSGSLPLTIGQINNSSINGYIAGVRITKGARYTADFTPPSSAFLPYAGQLAGNIIESLDITDWRIAAYKSTTGALLGTTTTTGSSYSINSPNLDPHVISIWPDFDYKWSSEKVAAENDLVIPSAPDTTPHLYKVTTAGTFDTTEATWNLSGTTTQGTATLTYVAPLVDPKSIGPKIPQ